jgi:3-hydroxyacyl-CoA dehydrogenase
MAAPGHIAVVGSGTIGASWAAYFLSRGYDVAAYDPAPDAGDLLRGAVDEIWPLLERIGLAPGASRGRLTFRASIADAASGASFVQESGPEQEDVKRATFKQLDGVLPADVIIASSSSGLLISRIQTVCKHPERCIIGHPFNPPHLIPLVEVVGGLHTAPSVIERAMAFYRGIGKHPIHIRKEIRGHVANRLQAALWREAVSLAAQNIISVGDIDAAVAHGPGLRWAIMGPSLTFHLGGGRGGMRHFLKHLGGSVESWWSDLGAPSLTPEVQNILVDGVDAEVGSQSTDDLANRRDRLLVELIRVVRKEGGVTGNEVRANGRN